MKLIKYIILLYILTNSRYLYGQLDIYPYKIFYQTGWEYGIIDSQGNHILNPTKKHRILPYVNDRSKFTVAPAIPASFLSGNLDFAPILGFYDNKGNFQEIESGFTSITRTNNDRVIRLLNRKKGVYRLYDCKQKRIIPNLKWNHSEKIIITDDIIFLKKTNTYYNYDGNKVSSGNLSFQILQEIQTTEPNTKKEVKPPSDLYELVHWKEEDSITQKKHLNKIQSLYKDSKIVSFIYTLSPKKRISNIIFSVKGKNGICSENYELILEPSYRDISFITLKKQYLKIRRPYNRQYFIYDISKQSLVFKDYVNEIENICLLCEEDIVVISKSKYTGYANLSRGKLFLPK